MHRKSKGRIVAVFCGMTTIREEAVAMFAAERINRKDDCTSYIPIRVNVETARCLQEVQKQVALLNEE